MPPPPRRTRTRRKTVVFAGLAFAVLYAALEFVAAGALWWLNGNLSITALHDRQLALAAMSPTDTVARDVAAAQFDDRQRLHPYLGYVLDPDQNWPPRTAQLGVPISDFGFRDVASPVRRRDGQRVIVALLGGSVARMLGDLGTETLADELRRHADFADKRIDFVRMGLGGYRQPQQLMALTYVQALGGEFDIVVNLDGFNEVALPLIEDRPGAWPAARPRGWDLMSERAPDAEVLRAIGRVAYYESSRRDVAGWMAGPWRWSMTCNLAWSIADQMLANSAVAAHQAVETHLRDIDTPAGEGRLSQEDYLGELVELWSRCSRQLDRVCRAAGARYFHFLQPNQYFAGSKPMTEAELLTAYRDDSQYRRPVELGYPRLREAGAGLAADGVRFTDLSMLFADVREPVYIDPCCHFNQLGNDVMARAIGRAILADRGPASRADAPTLQKLWCETADLELTAPFERAALRVLAEDVAGDRHDVTYAGVQFTSTAPEIVAVDRWGEVEARRPGTALVTARLGDLHTEVAVSVAFAPNIDLGGGSSWWPGESLRLSVRSHNDHLEIRVDGATHGRAGLVSMSVDPVHEPFCGGMQFVRPERGIPLHLEVGTSTLTIPSPAAMLGATVFAQVFVQDSERHCGFSMSNGVAVRLTAN